MQKELIAPCGFNCGVCRAHLRKSKSCPGCLTRDTKCRIKSCDIVKANESRFCFKCEQFPCKRLKQLDKRYRTRYEISMVENLVYIKDKGITAFLEREEEKWRCPECDGVISCQEGFCLHCAQIKRKSRKQDKSSDNTEELLVGPCGMNCGICSSYLAMKYDVQNKGLNTRYCAGCRPSKKTCAFIIKRCELILSREVEYCYECYRFPCSNLEKLDRRYREQYHMSMIENMKYIGDNGMDEFLHNQEKRWKCPDCGGTISCHNGICYQCCIEKLKSRKSLNGWDKDS
jgi:hypothetical protein